MVKIEIIRYFPTKRISIFLWLFFMIKIYFYD